MNLFAVRIFRNNKWAIVRWYSDKIKATEFAQNLNAEWDVKRFSYEEMLGLEFASRNR